MRVIQAKHRKWGPVTCIETGEVYATPTEAAKAIGLKTSKMVRKSILLERDCKSLHFAYGRLTGDALEKARHELEMKARQNLDRGVPGEYEIGVPVRILKPGLIECMPVPAKGVITSIDIDARHPLTVRTRAGLVYYLKLEEVQLA